MFTTIIITELLFFRFLQEKFRDLLKEQLPVLISGLLRTEDVSTEFPVEEDFWAAGAEFADSIGADIISSSLGYYNFRRSD